MIDSADEFVRLRSSSEMADYTRAAQDEAPESVWLEVTDRFPDYRFWVAQNKTVPLTVLERLRHDDDRQVRNMVRAKGAWRRAHPDDWKMMGDPE